MVSGLVTSVQGKIIAGKHVVVGKVRHSQRMNDPLVNIWVITESDGTILAAHCLGCKAGLAESCSHIASVLFYIEAWIRINGKLACTQVQCSWLLPTYVNEVSYERVKDIDFSSSKKLKENLYQKINSLEDKAAKPAGNYRIQSSYKAAPPSAEEIGTLFTKLGNCKTKAVALSLLPAYADQFVAESRAVPVVTDLFNTENLDMNFPELLKLCLNVNLDISDEQIKQVEKRHKVTGERIWIFQTPGWEDWCLCKWCGFSQQSGTAPTIVYQISLLSKFIQAKHESNQTWMQI